MGIGRVLGAAAPIAAGYFAGPAGFAGLTGTGAAIAAGAATGAGIAALSGGNVLEGGFMGGLGGMSGGAMGTAAAETAKQSALQSGAAATTAEANKLIATSPFTSASVDPKTLAFQEGKTFLPSSYSAPAAGPQQIAPSIQAGQGPNMAFRSASSNVPGGGGYQSIGDTFAQGVESGRAAFKDPGTFVEKLGGGSKAMGAGRLGLTGLGVAGSAGAFDPEPIDIRPRPEEKYDPNRRLNLSMNTGIDEALRRDTGLRLLAQGGEVKKYQYGGNIMGNTNPSYNLGSPFNQYPQGGGPPPEYGKIDVGGKFVKISDKKAPGLISKSDYEEQYGKTTAEKNEQDGGGGGGMDPNLSPGGEEAGDKMNPGAISALAAGFAQQQTNPPTESQTLGLEALAGGGYLETGGEVGDGMSDEIEATIEGSQEARLSDGEFVIPADVVSHLGNGSSDAGARRLYEMMDKVRMARTGTKKQGKEINPERYMPA